MNLFTRSIFTILCIALSVLTAKGQVTAGFTSSPTSGCAPLVVAFTNTTTPVTGTTYSWDLGNSTGIITLTNPGTSYYTPGTYTVTLTATNGSATSTVKQVITVFPSPAVNFTESDTLICPGAPVTYTSTTVAGVPGPVIYLWSFGDGYTSTLASVAHAYSFPGYFNITLEATNSDGCSSTLTKPAFLHVRNPPVPLFSAANTHICNPPVNANFTNGVTGAGPFTYRWNFGDGSPDGTSANPVHSYSALGFYNVQLMVTDIHGCEDSNTVTSYIDVLHLIASFTGPDSVCVNSPVTFSNTSSPYLSKQWLYGDGAMDTNITGHQTYPAGGIDTVRLITYNGFCYDTAKRRIYIQAPVPTFTITPPIPCPAPETSFFTATVVPNSTVFWNFGDGHTGTGITTPHTYVDDSFYLVTMISITDLGCRDTVIDSYSVYNISYGIGNSNPDSLGSCVPYTVHFYESTTSTTPPPFIIPPVHPYPATFTYLWNFGDGSPLSTSATPTHTYTAQGGWIVTLTLHSSNGCTFVCHDSIPVGIKPNVTFTASPLHACEDTNNITFIGTTISGNPQSFLWLVGIGNYGTNPTTTTDTLSYHYLIPGLFSDTLIAYNYGCPDTFIRHNYIQIDSPNAKVFPHINCSPPNSVNFIDSSMGDDKRIWFFGDGITDSTRYPLHLYSSPGLYNVVFSDYNIHSGCRDTSKFTLDLTRPVVTFSTPDSAICRDGFVILNSSVTGYASYYEWFADGVSTDYNNYNFVDTFHATGYYTILLVVHDVNGCPDSIKRVNYILVAKPVANFTVSPANICLPQGATFTDASTDVPGTVLQHYSWSFGDTTATVSTTTPSVGHTFTATGTYTTTEIVTDNIGCKDTTVLTLANVFHPFAAFIASTTSTCAFTPISFSCYSYPIVTWFWDFGDGGTSTLKNPNKAYSDSGTYTVRLIVTDVHGCTDTATMLNYIHISRPYASFTESDSVAFCPPFTVHFTNASTGGISNKWLFGNGDSSVAANPTNIYTSPGYDTVRLIVTNAVGCKDTADSRHVKIYGYAGAFTYSADSGCAPFPVTFNASLSEVAGLSNITWDFSDGIVVTGSITDSVITHTYLNPGSYIPKMIINVASTGCVDTSLGASAIKVDGITKGFIATPDPVCVNNTITLADTSESYWSEITSWSWNVNGTTDSTDTVYAVYNTVGTYSFTLKVTDGWGCNATDTGSVTVISILGITISPDSVICTGASTHLSDPAPGGNWTSNHTSIAVVGSSSGIVTGITGGSAIITYGLTDGCSATATVTVIPYPNPGIITGKAGVCAGDTIQLTDTTAGGTWSSGNGSATITTNGLVKGITANTDTFFYTLANGQCDSTAMKIIRIYPLPNPGTIAGQTMICPGAVITLTDSILNGRWTSGDTTIATVDSLNGVVKAINLGTTVITYTTAPTAFGCFSTAVFPIDVINTDFTITTNISQVKCYNDSDAGIRVIISGGNPPFAYLWSTGSTDSFITGLDTGNYSLMVTEKTTDCIVYDKIVVTQPDTLQISADITEDVCRGSKGIIAATVKGGTPPYTYLWNDKQTGSSISGLLTGNYELSVTDINGCSKKMTFTVPDTCTQIIIYDAISPNGDGINDTWNILGLELFPANTVQLFDKWGDEVFSVTNYKNDFAGKGKKGELPDGTYYYLVKLNSSNAPEGKGSFTGYLMIKR